MDETMETTEMRWEDLRVGQRVLVTPAAFKAYDTKRYEAVVQDCDKERGRIQVKPTSGARVRWVPLRALSPTTPMNSSDAEGLVERLERGELTDARDIELLLDRHSYHSTDWAVRITRSQVPALAKAIGHAASLRALASKGGATEPSNKEKGR